MSYPNADISFPGLFGDWRFTLSPKLLDIGNGIYWYGVLIAAGLLIALWFCMKRAPRYGLTEDDVIDTVLWAIPFAIVGARVYYVLFYLDSSALRTAASTGRRPTASGTAGLPSTAASSRHS